MAYVSPFECADGLFLRDLLPSVGAHQGVPGCDQDRLGLPDAASYVVVLVDGLGWELAVRAIIDAPYIAGLIGDSIKAEVGLPTTTAASLTSLWTGVLPGRHGLVGFSFRLHGRIVTPLSLVKPIPTAASVMDQMARAGVAVSCVIPAEHVGSGLTRMSTQSARITGIDEYDARAKTAAIVRAVGSGQRSFVYAYDSRLDHAGHQYGVASEQWRRALSAIDSWLEDLRSQLDDGVRLLVTGDHGMVDVQLEDRVVIDTDPVLRRGVHAVGGEPRFRHLYTDTPQAVAERWRGRLEDQASVLTRSEAVEAGLFGPVDDQFLSRLGDVIVIPTSGQAYLTATFPGEFSLVGMHGAATTAERYVPILID